MHFVSGDVTHPVKPKAIIIQCVDDSGQWGSGGVFTALSKVTTEPELHYELAGDMGDLSEGDVHLVSCSDISGYTDYQVALLLAQDRKLRVKQSLLATCLKKLAHAAEGLEGISVHLPRIGYNTTGFDWYSTERQLRKFLSNRKIHTYVYYYRRPKRQLSPIASVTKRSRSQSPLASTSAFQSTTSSFYDSQSEPDDDSGDNHVSTVQSPALSPSALNIGVLEDIFSNIDFFIDPSIDSKERKRLRRYIIAFDGNVQNCETENTGFVVTAGVCNASPNSTCIPVGPEFVYDSICDGRLLSR